MKEGLSVLINNFAKLKIIVIGEAMLDSYLKGVCQRLSPEAPVPVLSLRQRENVPGGAANTAVNVNSLGAQTFFLSVVGDDAEGNLLRQALTNHQLSTEHLLTQPRRQTLAKQRVIADSQMVVRFDQGSTEPIGAVIEQTLIDRLTYLFPKCDALIVSDYNYGILTPRLIQTIAALQAQTPRLVAVDSKRLPAYRPIGPTVVKPNYKQVTRLLNLKPEDEPDRRLSQISGCETEILELTGARLAAVTLDADGALIFEQGQPPYRVVASPVAQAYPAGAGDTFISALTLALAAGAPAAKAGELASTAAAVVVSKNGTTPCSAGELRGAIASNHKIITDLAYLLDQITFYRRQGHRIIFTNGCFDILHRGHISYLKQAKALGHTLVVGLNTDDGVRRLKGPNRPINSLEDRAQVLAALNCVDHVIPFDEDTPDRLIRAIRPDIFVKGGDYTRATLPEASLVEALGGVIKFLPYVDNFSTTSLIERIDEALQSLTNGHRVGLEH